MTDFTRLPDLALRTLGGSVIAASDEFFAEKENLIKPEPPAFRPRTFGHKGQVYDGWETRRRRPDGPPGSVSPEAHDWAVVRLGMPGVIRGVVVDTAHFTGNHPSHVAVSAAAADGHPAVEELAGWVALLPRGPLRGDAAEPFAVSVERRFTHVRLSIFPDGGVARLRVHGEVVPDPRLLEGLTFDLAALENGGAVTGCSDMFYSAPENLLFPGRARVMGDGWETARRRGEGNDWVTVRLGARGVIALAELDTTHFLGNAPAAASLSGRDGDGEWFPLLPLTRLRPDTRHRFRLSAGRPATQVRLDVHPDGGMARMRLHGTPTKDGWDLLAERFAALTRASAR